MQAALAIRDAKSKRTVAPTLFISRRLKTNVKLNLDYGKLVAPVIENDGNF
jgi:hypothetical protein